nr:ferric-rhodotorulic acid/ferric-coprogen receptor FhuE [Aureimonas sp. ME7]
MPCKAVRPPISDIFEPCAAATDGRHSFACSRRSLAIGSAIALLSSSAFAQSVEADADMVVLDTVVVTGDGGAGSEKGYSVVSTGSATKLDLTPRETPQSVTVVNRQRIEDQNLRTVGEVLVNTTGVSQRSFDSERLSYFSRGYRINSYLFDGLPTTLGSTGSYSEGTLDTAIYERIEVVRGATGLMTGVGDPSASVNLVRKRATSDVFTATVTGSAGSWNDWRGLADVSTPLTREGTVRGRFVTSLRDTESQLDRYENGKQLFYGTVDADLSENTTLSVALDYQESRPEGNTWGGLPIWDSNGNPIRWSRSFSPAPDWSHWYTTNKGVTADLEHRFDNGWTARAVAAHAETEADEKLGSVSGFPDARTGRLRYQGGRFIENRDVDSFDGYATGPVELFGREHDFVVGVSASRQTTGSLGAARPTFFVDNIFTFDGDVAEPNWGPLTNSGTTDIDQQGVYATSRWNVRDDLKLILGGRLAAWETSGSAGASETAFVPYTGVVYDLTDTVSVYGSYTGIFNPQTLRDTTGAYLKPLDGKSYEFGVKSALFDDSLDVTFAVFRTEQDNLGVADGSNIVPGTGAQAYVAASGTRSQGFEIELSGAVTDRWNITGGLAHYDLKAEDGAAVNTYIPRTTVNLFTSYNPQILDDKLTLGGGARLQSRIYADVASPTGTRRVEEDGYAVVDLFAKYEFVENVTGQVNLSNLFDRRYYSQLGFGSYVGFGPGRSVIASLSYKY